MFIFLLLIFCDDDFWTSRTSSVSQACLKKEDKRGLKYPITLSTTCSAEQLRCLYIFLYLSPIHDDEAGIFLIGNLFFKCKSAQLKKKNRLAIIHATCSAACFVPPMSNVIHPHGYTSSLYWSSELVSVAEWGNGIELPLHFFSPKHTSFVHLVVFIYFRYNIFTFADSRRE